MILNSNSERCLGLQEWAEEVSRTRARLAREGLEELAPRLRRRASLVVLQVPRLVRQALEQEASLVRTGVSAARPYGWHEIQTGAARRQRARDQRAGTRQAAPAPGAAWPEASRRR